jgi:hypothetical protein
MGLRRINFALIALSIFAFASFASADITPALTNVTPSGGNFSWNYSIAVDANEQLNSGSSFFTIYDVVGLVSAAAPAGWTDSIQLIGITPSTQAPPDSGSLENVTFSYVGGVTILGPVTIPGPFSIVSTSDSENAGGVFAYQAGKQSGGNDQGQGPLTIPGNVPEGSELSMLGISGIAMLGAMKRKFVS